MGSRLSTLKGMLDPTWLATFCLAPVDDLGAALQKAGHEALVARVLTECESMSSLLFKIDTDPKLEAFLLQHYPNQLQAIREKTAETLFQCLWEFAMTRQLQATQRQGWGAAPRDRGYRGRAPDDYDEEEDDYSASAGYGGGSASGRWDRVEPHMNGRRTREEEDMLEVDREFDSDEEERWKPPKHREGKKKIQGQGRRLRALGWRGAPVSADQAGLYNSARLPLVTGKTVEEMELDLEAMFPEGENAAVLQYVRRHLNPEACSWAGCFRLPLSNYRFLDVFDVTTVICTICPCNNKNHAATLTLNAPGNFSNLFKHLQTAKHREVK